MFPVKNIRVKDRRDGEFTPFPVPAHPTGHAALPSFHQDNRAQSGSGG